MQLPDGRLFEYSAAGDPDRELLVFCVGTPSAVVEFPYVAEAAAARGLRSVICSRPGYGGSTRNQGRRWQTPPRTRRRWPITWEQTASWGPAGRGGARLRWPVPPYFPTGCEPP